MPIIISRGEKIVVIEDRVYQRTNVDSVVFDARPHSTKPGHKVAVRGGTLSAHVGPHTRGLPKILRRGLSGSASVEGEYVTVGDLQGFTDQEQEATS